MPNSPSSPHPRGDTADASLQPDEEIARFERVDWDQLDRPRRLVSPELLVLLAGLIIVAVALIRHLSSGEVFLVFRWNVGWEDWLLLVTLVLLLAFFFVPMIREPARTYRIIRRFHGHWGTITGIVIFSGIFIVGVWALLSGYRALIPWEVGIDPLQPPVGTSLPMDNAADCVGRYAEEAGTGVCHGSWMYPLGTDTSGYKITELLVMGTRPVVYATVLTLGLIVPLATVVGVVAGYYGGIIDDVLMAYVDIQLSFPAILIYLVFYMFVLNSMAVFLLAFGLLSWGGIARIVRSETLQLREEGHVLAAQAVGAPRRYILRHHLLPNVANSAMPAAFHLIAIIVLTEAGLSFLDFNPIDQSWGHTIQRGFTRASPIHHWWIATFPAIALAITVVSCKLIGDGFRDILDPRGER